MHKTLIIISIFAFQAHRVEPQNHDASYYRLPETVIPVRYNVTLQPYLYDEPPSFLGSVSIETIAVQSTYNITLHARNLGLSRDNVIVLDDGGNEIGQRDPTWLDEPGFYVLNLEIELQSGRRYTIVASNYTGRLNLNNDGFYLAKYSDGSNIERRIATTQFQSLGARMTYPCFDEPSFKATYNVELVRNSTYSSISNQRKISETQIPNTDYVKDTYQEMPLTPSYAMAFVVSEFSWIGNDEFKIYARPEAIADGLAEHALLITPDIILSLEYYLDIPYTLPKLDQIAIPDEYFAAGAMENWGLVTYRETLLLVDEERSTSGEKQRVSYVIAHELAHMWFGNLVTLQWWNFLWLNEGFATYFSYSVFNLVEPTWRMMDQIIVSSVQYSLSRDCLNSTQPINYATNPPGGGPPSWVAYEKGASVLRMIESFVGADIFQRSLTLYLTRHQFSVVISEDLYSTIQTVVENHNATQLTGNLIISQILSTWEYQAGYPIVTISRNFTSGLLTITQSKFRIYNISAPDSELWYIPINFACGDGSADFSNTTADLWLTQKQANYSITCNSQHWLLLNKKQTGFYRVNYDGESWNRIITHLSANISGINVLNRAQLIDDSFNLAKVGYLSYKTALNLSLFLAQENDYIPWWSYFTVLDFLIYNTAGSDIDQAFKNYIFSLTDHLLPELTFNESARDSHVVKLHRNIVLRYLCSLDHPQCLSQSEVYLQRWQQQNEVVPANLQEAVFCGSMKSANQTQWNFLLAQYLNESHYRYSYRPRILASLGCSNNPSILTNYLDLIVDENSTIEGSHQSAAFQSVIRSGRIGLEVAFRYIEDNLPRIANRVQGTILQTLATRLTEASQLQRLETLANNSGLDIFGTPLLLARENVQWVQTYVEDIRQWLHDFHAI